MSVAVLFVLFLGLAFLGVPIGFAIGIGVLGSVFTSNIISLSYFVRAMANSVDSFTLTAVPFFVLAGQIMSEAGISEGLFKAANVWVGRLKGGIMMVTVLACMAFGAISGSAYATIAAIGLIALPELRKQGLSHGRLLRPDDSSQHGTGCIREPEQCVYLQAVYGRDSAGIIHWLLFPGILPYLRQKA